MSSTVIPSTPSFPKSSLYGTETTENFKPWCFGARGLGNDADLVKYHWDSAFIRINKCRHLTLDQKHTHTLSLTSKALPLRGVTGKKRNHLRTMTSYY